MKIRLFLALLSVITVAVALPGRAVAQVGNDNPTGPDGIFNGDVATGGSYDPYTGNVTRSITDIAVAGAVGTQPLVFSRTNNSRNTVIAQFGGAGEWTHNYQWILSDSAEVQSSRPIGAFAPTSYSVYFPDGRGVNFASASSWDSTCFRGGAGVLERFIPLNTTTNLAYLVLADGSKIEFKATENFERDSDPVTYYAWYSYTAQAIIDRYGLRTAFTTNADGSFQITEPAGRWIKIYYTTIALQSVVDHVTASDGRSVQYYYVQTTFSPNTHSTVCLDHVVYYGDSTLTARYQYQYPNVSSSTLAPLLKTADDPLYAGPMKRIAYVYKTGTNPDSTTAAYGQILSENYFDGTNIGAALTTLTVNGNVRTETRADTKTRTFTYSSGYLTNVTDFKGASASQTYDSHKYINAITDRNGHTTNYTLNALTGVAQTITFPATPGDVPTGTPRGTVSYTYGSSSCADSNNRDASNPYYICTATDEGGHITSYTRDSNKRVTQITYPDGGSESFVYNSFGEVTSHTMKTGGIETFSYDSTGLKQTYRDPYHSSGNPSAWYQYDSFYRVSGVTDTLGSGPGDANHTTNFTYNARGQLLVTTHPFDPNDGVRHTIANVYNPDGTLQSRADELNQITSYTYDDYRRPLSVTTPGHNTPLTAYTYYDTSGTGNDYTHTDANATHSVSPSGEITVTAYDENYRKLSMTMAFGTSDAATTTYGYDNNGNVTQVNSPNEQTGQQFSGQSTVTAYDERNRWMSTTDPVGNVTSYRYDAAGNKASLTRANGQMTTFDSYDSMNRLLQQTVKQAPDPDAVTKYTYYSSGLLHTMQDPLLVANSSTFSYGYSYDQMGRKTGLAYPPDSNNVQRSESWHYDIAGRNDIFTNRAGAVQTLSYDTLNRKTGFSWNDGLTPSVNFGYDAASRMISVTNAYATITRTYFSDNAVSSETTTYADDTARTINYTYNANGNRSTIQYPNGAYSFTYNYTNRNQLQTIVDNSISSVVITYGYDADGNLISRAPNNGTNSSYSYDGVDRVTHIGHTFNGDARTFDYAYDSVSNREWAKRDGGAGDVFGYDLNDQSTSVLLNVSNPDTTSPGSQTIMYDANGNRASFSPYGTTDTYTTNNLNQYASRNSATAVYDNNGNMTIGLDGSTYSFDAQNRLLSATKSGNTETFAYDGLNRQVSRTIGSGSPVYNVYDGWELIGEYTVGSATPQTAYLSGVGGLAKVITATSSYYFYQDVGGSTSHLTDSTGHLVECYRYDLQGTPTFLDPSGSLRTNSYYGIRHLFTGQQWYNDIGLYDLRNRYYSPDIGRFLHADPTGFDGDASNLYRYCANNPLKHSDPSGTTMTGGLPQFKIYNFNKHTDHGDDYGNANGFSSIGAGGVTDGCFVGYDADYAFLSNPMFGGNSMFATTTIRSAALAGNLAYRMVNDDGSYSDTVITTEAVSSIMVGFVSFTEAKSCLDSTVLAQLDRIYGIVSSANVTNMTSDAFMKFMFGLDTSFHFDASSIYYYGGSLGPAPGAYYGSAINYIGVGEGFAAAGWSLPEMDAGIVLWKTLNAARVGWSQSNFLVGGEFDWARVGYYYYVNRSGGG